MKGTKNEPVPNALVRDRMARAQAVAAAGGLDQAVAAGTLPQTFDLSLSEAVVLGLMRQGVRKYLCVFGHGSTDVGEVLRVYSAAGVVSVYNVRNEIAATHAATALRWVTGEKAAVITSIGPGAMQALAGSLAAASDGIGVWHLFGDETTEDEGPNMQQIPKREQGLFLKLCSMLSEAYSLHTPEAIGTALRRGMACVDRPYRAGPFYLLLPMNKQPAMLRNFNLDELPSGTVAGPGAASDQAAYHEAVEALLSAERVVIKAGGGARGAGPEIIDLADLADGVIVTSPLVSGVVPYHHLRNMTVGGSKGSICGNHAMEEADLLVAVGSRVVCQSDSSRTGYPKVRHVININADLADALHYGKTTALVGDAKKTLFLLNELLRARGAKATDNSPWLRACRVKKREWDAFKAMRYTHPTLRDPVWGKEVLTQPAAIKVATDWARKNGAVVFFDAGDVQANGFQIVEDDRLGRTFTETGASYMGFAASALLATALAPKPFYGLAVSGDGSFTMNPQILIDGVQHGARGCVLLLDNRRMAAISSLQTAQYGADFATNDSVAVDYVAWASSVKGVLALEGGRTQDDLFTALDRAHAHKGLSLIHVPVYFGTSELGGLGAHGRWNVGNWVEATQAMRHKIGL